MAQHKWHKEIKAWADGAEIQRKEYGSWVDCNDPVWNSYADYRIKPQPKENEFAHIPYWLCCGSLDPHHHKTSCSEAKAGYPERCRFGTAAEHQKRMGKPQPKEPQYLYIYERDGVVYVNIDAKGWEIDYIGKIKLETEND